MGRAHEFHEVGQFHHKFGLDNVTYKSAGPREVDGDTLIFRMKFLCEELEEFFNGVGISNSNWNVEKDQAKMFDSLIDLVYVAYGTAHLLGYPWAEGWNAVQAANMAKVRAQPDGSDSTRGSALDVVKPEGWTPPDIEGILQSWGF